jgi:folate-binding protein YgfZ
MAVVIDEQNALLRLSADLRDPMVEHLKKYLQFSRANLEACDYPVVGVIGQATATDYGAKQLTELSQPQKIAAGWLIPRDADTAEVIITEPTELDKISLEVDPDRRNPEAWQAHAVSRGEARIREQTSGKYLPQDLNYDLAGWVAFDKGCYTGQEIIARLHWRGQPKRRLYRATATTAPRLGASLMLGVNGTSRGSVVGLGGTGAPATILLEATTEALTETLWVEGINTPLENTVGFATDNGTGANLEAPS